MSMSNKGDSSYYDNVVNNFFRYVDNLKRDRRNNKADDEEFERKWRQWMIKYPSIFAKTFSDNPADLEEAKQEVLQRIAQIQLKHENK